VAQVCPAVNCDYAGAPGFNPGDLLLWTEDASGNGTGPLILTFTPSVPGAGGAGFYLELTAPGSFGAIFKKIAGANSTEYPMSDSNGNPLFIGALDPAADITGITVGILSCTSGSPGACNAFDFAIDRLYLASSVPEPATLIPVFVVLALLTCCSRRKFLAKARSRNGPHIQAYFVDSS
jgi:hypothetical protein